jgi:hypothetical protein
VVVKPQAISENGGSTGENVGDGEVKHADNDRTHGSKVFFSARQFSTYFAAPRMYHIFAR